jgi:hypothetical protein
MNEDDTAFVVDLIDDAVLGTAGAPPSGELANQRFAYPSRLYGKCLEEEREDCLSHLVRQPPEVSMSFGGDLDVVHSAWALESDHLTGRRIPARPAE